MSYKNDYTENPQLQELKERLRIAAKINDPKYISRYYLSNYADNVFEPAQESLINGDFNKMFMCGDGHELNDYYDEKGEFHFANAKAIHSSSMLAFNFFHWINADCPLTLDNVQYTKVYFEVRMKTLDLKIKDPKKEHPANMDVVLVSDDCKSMLCIESKFTEPMDDKVASFAKSYGMERRYYADNNYKQDFIRLQNEYNGKRNGYYDGIKQNICHLIALSNLKHDEDALQWFKENNPCIEQEVLDKINKDTTIKFVNLLYLFDYKNNSNDKYGNNYPFLLEYFKSKLPKELRDELLKDDCIFRSYHELFDDKNINRQMPDGLLVYLENRYFKI